MSRWLLCVNFGVNNNASEGVFGFLKGCMIRPLICCSMKGIPGRYLNDATPSHAIYPSSRENWFISLLVCSKAVHCVGIFLAFDLLKTVDAISLLFSLKLVAATIFLYIQKPLSSGPPLSQSQWFWIGQYAVLKTAVSILWLYGTSLCGPFRTILITQHYDIAIITGIGALFSGVRGPAVIRGAAFFLAAVVSLVLLDHDEGQQHSGDSHLFSGVVSWLGLADHKLGVLFLCCFLPLQVGSNVLLKRIAADIGSQHRVHALATLMEAIICAPWTLIASWLQDRHEFFTLSNILPIGLAAVSIFVIVYYVDSACLQRSEVTRIARIGSISISLWALLAAVLWHQPWVSRGDGDILPEEHGLSGGGILACGLFMLATLSLTSVIRQGARGSFVGYSSSGLPLYNLTNSALHHTSRSVVLTVSSILKQIVADSNSRRIFYFLCLNFSFTVVEFVYGVWTNSLGLISDGFHMLFDCSALVMGLLASIMARWKSTKTFSYGYGRVEDLSGFVNGLFLLVIALFVFSEALSRLFDPPHINTQRLLIVSVAGLCVNLIGILAFRQSTSHSHGHQHGHRHGHSHNANMEGVFLHIMADTLGSVGVIVSSILIEQLGWFIADPVCSLFIAVLIFVSVIPLLKQSAYVLLLRTPVKLQEKLTSALDQVSNVAGVVRVQEPHFWQHSSEVYMGTLHVHATPEASEQNIIQQVCVIFKETGIHQFCLQVEKEDFFTHMSGLNSQLPGYASGMVELDPFFMVKAV